MDAKARRFWTSVVALGLGLSTSCALLQPAPEGPGFPAAEARPIDLYVAQPPSASAALANGEDAVARALREDELLRHLRSIDARYSGRRRETLVWTAAAVFRTELAPEASEEGAAGTSSRVKQAIEADGGYWSVELASDVRETGIFYVCELALSTAGEALEPFEARRMCDWKNR